MCSCSWTPYEEWEGINDDELRSYVNVIEDTRIDKLIQAKVSWCC